MEGLEVFGGAFVADAESAEVVEPGEGPFDDVAGLPESASGLAGAAGFEEGADAALADVGDGVREPVPGVALDGVRLGAGPADGAGEGREGVEEGREALLVALVGRAGLDDEGEAVGVGQEVAFAPGFAAVGRVGAGVVPPKTARTEALSATTRATFSRPAFPSAVRILARMAANTPAAVHAFSRRQQVAPLPQPSSAGRRFHAIPDRRTKMIPVRAWRSATGGRPPAGDAGRFGIRGSTTDQSSSLTSAAMEGLRARVNHRHRGGRY